jgi:hypothetical protein
MSLSFTIQPTENQGEQYDDVFDRWAIKSMRSMSNYITIKRKKL